MIILDIPCFYYHMPVPPDGIATVLDLMNAAKGAESPTGGVLDFELDRNRRFVQTISVHHRRKSDPECRYQNLSVLPTRRPTGGNYSFTDDVTDPKNWINGPGRVPGLHTWQHYVFDSQGRTKSHLCPTGLRDIAPLAETQPLATGEPLEDGDRAVWRLVALFGLNHFFEAHRDTLRVKTDGKPIGLKSAIAILREDNLDLLDFTIDQ